ncbi:hypothetical protein [Actinomadura barringtoniae]|uniref:hypothetical protein n=1 Tax=Actinomadura barringtoniae TaxID=1427535 RepID=UPI001FB7DB54|nr:hypothetical protein [Actinomadura barringtoniae]
MDVVFYRAFGEVQDGGEVVVEAASDDEAQDLLLTGCELGAVVAEDAAAGGAGARVVPWGGWIVVADDQASEPDQLVGRIACRRHHRAVHHPNHRVLPSIR